MRPELLPSKLGRAECERLVERAFRAMDQGRIPEDERLALERQTGRPVSIEDLHAWFESVDPAEVAVELTVPAQLQVDGLTRGELVDIVRRLIPNDELYDHENEAYWTALFEANVPRPAAANLIYHPPDDLEDVDEWDPKPEEVVELALAYRPIEL